MCEDDERTEVIGRVRPCKLRDGRTGPVVIDTWFEDPSTEATYIICRAIEGGSIPVGKLVFFRMVILARRAHFIGIPDEREYERAQGIWIRTLQQLHYEQREFALTAAY